MEAGGVGQVPVRLALIGAGVFAHKAHLPSLQKHSAQVEIVAICTRSPQSAAAAARGLPGEVAIFTDVAALLAQEDVDAVDVVVPIQALPEVVEQVLASGKHLVSEKPLAPTVAQGKALLAAYDRQGGQEWMVAENVRYEEAFLRAREAIAGGQIGRPLLCHWAVCAPVMPDTPSYRTGWRRSGDFPGGFLLDGGVHHVAALRLLLGEIASVSAVTAAHRPDLPPADTLSVALEFSGGAIGHYSVTYAAAAPWPSELTVIGDGGALRVQAARLEISRGGESYTTAFDPKISVEQELVAFLDTVQGGPRHRNTPEEALQDVAVVEAMLRSAEAGRRITPERCV